MVKQQSICSFSCNQTRARGAEAMRKQRTGIIGMIYEYMKHNEYGGSANMCWQDCAYIVDWFMMNTQKITLHKISPSLPIWTETRSVVFFIYVHTTTHSNGDEENSILRLQMVFQSATDERDVD